jgi:murE/murF fusion protein
LQRIQADDSTNYQRPVVFVDYAHSPDALKQVLATLKALPHRELYCVFGCGGNRDTGKRPLMGGFAGTFSDVVVVTDDNPRSEVPGDIRNQIVPGVDKAGLERQEDGWLLRRKVGERGYVVIGSRREAIAKAIRSARAGDIVLIAGKGHEKYQLGLNGKRFFDDCLEARTALLAWNLQAVAAATGGNLVNPTGDQQFLGDVSTDSRTIGEGDIFVALKGDRFDGHALISSGSEKGAGCLVVEQGHAALPDSSIPRVEVANTQQALGDLARFRRRLMATVQKQVVVGLTGSCGKTTVKEMTAAILRRRWPEGTECPAEISAMVVSRRSRRPAMSPRRASSAFN